MRQTSDANAVQVSFTFDPLQLLRFITLHFITTPPNYKWQEFLERSLPGYATPTKGRYTSIPLEERDVEKDRDSNAGDLNDDDDDGAQEVPSQRKTKSKLNIKNTALKWFIDCITLGAIMNTAAFLIIMGFLKGQTATEVGHNLKTKELQIILDGYKLWPWAGLISFTLIPMERRIVFFSFVGLCWNIYLSIVAARL